MSPEDACDSVWGQNMPIRMDDLDSVICLVSY